MIKIKSNQRVVFIVSIIFSLLFTAHSAFASEYKPFLRTDVFLYSESVSLDGALHSWRGDLDKDGETQIGSLWLEAGVRKKNWLLSALYREEYLSDYHSDTAELYHSIENDNLLDAGRRYVVDLDVARYKMTGLRVAHDFVVSPALKVSLGSSLFRSKKLLNGSLKGLVLASSSQDYDYDVNVDYHYDDDVLFNRPNVNQPTGTGLSIDLASTWQVNKNIDIDVDIKDLLGVIHWRDAPFTRAAVTSDTKTFTPDGLVQIEPALEGVEGNESSYQQYLKPRGDFSIRYQGDHRQTSWLLQSKYYSSLTLFGFGAAKPVKHGYASVVLWPEAQTIEAKYKYRNMYISLGIDDLDVSKANAFWLSFGLN